MENRPYSEDCLPLKDVLCREYAVRECCGERRDALNQATRLLSQPEDIQTSLSRDQLSEAVSLLSEGRNAVQYDQDGYPSIMVHIPTLYQSDLIKDGDPHALHPAFVEGQSKIWVGKYQSSDLNGHACSLPMGKPIYSVNYDEAQRLCSQKGSGWSLTPFALRMAIALFCRRNGFLPHGNNVNGHDFFHPEEKGIPVGNGQTLCGSGPATWTHDGTPNGLCDLNGNLNEWDIGLRLLDGEIQFIPMNVLLQANVDLGLNSPLWQALDETGAFVPPGMTGTLKYDAPDGHIRLTRTCEYPGIGNCAFADLQIEANLEPPQIAKLLGLYPESDRSGYGLGWRWISTYGEVLPLCGGGFRADDHAGVFFVGATYPRTKDYNLTGFRVCYHD